MTTTIPSLAPPKSESKTRSRAWMITGLLFVFIFLNFADKAILGFAGKQIRTDLAISPQQFGLLQSAFFWTFALGAILVGALSLRVGLRWLLAGLMVVWILTMVPLVVPVSFGVLLACRIVLGFAEGPATSLAMHAVHSWFPADKRGLPSGVITAGASVGPLVAAPVLTWIIVTRSWHAAFGVLIVLGALWVVAWLVIGRDSPIEHTNTAADDASLPVDAPFRILLTTSTVIGIGLLTFFSYWATTLKISWLPLYLSEGLGYDTITAGRLITLPYAVAATAAIASGWFSNRLRARGVSRRIARGGLAGGLILISGTSMILFTVIGTGILQIVFISLAFSFNTAAFAVGMVAVADVVHPSKRGTILSFLVAFYSLAGVIAPLVLGHYVGSASDMATGYGHGFFLTGVMIVVGGIVATCLVRPDHDLARIRSRVQALQS